VVIRPRKKVVAKVSDDGFENIGWGVLEPVYDSDIEVGPDEVKVIVG
jgi:hypothetical protein